MQSTLFVHVPKTGGTTIDDLLGESCEPSEALRGVQYTGNVQLWTQLDNPRFRYVSGHIPAGAVDLDRFEQRYTVLRPPRDMLASMISYVRRYFADDDFAQRVARAEGRHAIYGEYFSPGFDRTRLVAELQYGVARRQFEYADPCTPTQALAMLDRFDRVLDFSRLDDEIKRLVIELGLFPRAAAPRLRSYAYEPDNQAAEALLVPFDETFFRRAQARFRPLPADLDAVYERYRAGYCESHGHHLARYATLDLPLSGPLGNGWFEPEKSEAGAWFRWANGTRPTLEIPLAEPGEYSLHVYVHPHRIEGVGARVESLIGRRRAVMKVSERTGVTVLHCTLRLSRADWLQVAFDGTDREAGVQGGGGTDRIQRIFVLGRVLLRRGPR